VHVREDRRDRPRLAGRLGLPRSGIKMFDDHLIHPIVGRKDPDNGWAALRMNLLLTHHGFQ
jgi:hypothetical protein